MLQFAAGIERLHVLGVPPGDPVLREYHRGVGTEQRPGGVGEDAEQVGLQRDEDRVLHPDALGAHRSRDDFVTVEQLHTPVFHRLQVRAARDDRDVVPGRGEPGGEVAADRAGAENAYTHFAIL